MAVAFAILEGMSEEVTNAQLAARVEDLATNIENLSDIVRDGFELFAQKFIEADLKFKEINKQLEIINKQLNKLNNRVDRMEHALYEIQSEFENNRQEMRGVHKVFDAFNGRLMTVEDYLGFPHANPEF
jgi:chromosome segregation ATPase